MSSLPEKGEVRAAAEALDERLSAAGIPEDGSASAAINVTTGEVAGDRPDAVRAVYGDLYDLAEMADVATAASEHFIIDIAVRRKPVEQALRSMYMLAAAHGVMLERRRGGAS